MTNNTELLLAAVNCVMSQSFFAEFQLNTWYTTMARRRLSKNKLLILGCCWIGFGRIAKSLSPPQVVDGVREVVPKEEICLPCDSIFSKLEPSEKGGKLFQKVQVRERGEPKSGTGFMFSWAGGTLVRTCRYLQWAFGA